MPSNLSGSFKKTNTGSHSWKMIVEGYLKQWFMHLRLKNLFVEERNVISYLYHDLKNIKVRSGRIG
jgi:hypothetical protein